jgi:hypothetical protein
MEDGVISMGGKPEHKKEKMDEFALVISAIPVSFQIS